jgi:hypothetical protein
MTNLSPALPTDKKELTKVQGLYEKIKVNESRLSTFSRAGIQKAYTRLAGTDGPDTDILWKMYAEQLRMLITGGLPGNRNLQLTTSLNPVRWNDPMFGGYYFQVDSADSLPDKGPMYARSASKFSDGYRDFLESLSPSAPVDTDALNNANQVLTDLAGARAKVLLLEDQFATDWTAYQTMSQNWPPSRRLTCDQWYQEVQADSQIDAAMAVVNAKYELYYYYMQKALPEDEPLLLAIKQYMDIAGSATDPSVTSKMVMVNVPRNSENPGDTIAQKLAVMPYVVSPDFPTWMKAAPNRQPNFTFTYQKDDQTYNYSQTAIGGGVGIFFGFFGALGAASRTTTQIDTSSSDFAFELSAVVEKFTIQPAAWYDGNIFKLYKDGPFKQGSPLQTAHDQGTLFGPNGLINFRPATAIVAYKPKCSVKFSQSDYHYFKQVTNGWAGFGIGPFVFGGASYSDVKIQVSSNDTTNTLNLFADDDFPYLLGFEYENVDPNAA